MVSNIKFNFNIFQKQISLNWAHMMKSTYKNWKEFWYSHRYQRLKFFAGITRWIQEVKWMRLMFNVKNLYLMRLGHIMIYRWEEIKLHRVISIKKHADNLIWKKQRPKELRRICGQTSLDNKWAKCFYNSQILPP